ncbi:helix-turn-helix domain-containing protein [Opitutaceae bacterium TAV3]|nr:helix-turn-helix domain-containing protein [Opitutaceae bacterium TAV3]
MKNPLRQIALDVALLIDTSTQWTRNIIHGVNRYKNMMRTPWNLLVEPHGSNDRLTLPAGWRGAGVIASIHYAEQMNNLRASSLPVVNVSDVTVLGVDRVWKTGYAGFPKVCTDRKAACELAVEHFTERGFTHFAYIDLAGNEWDRETHRYFTGALRAAGIKECASYEAQNRAWGAPDWSIDIDALGAWLRSLPKPVAVFSWSVGREVIHACRRVGLKVPEEVALLLLAYDEIFSEVGYVPISGIVHAWEEIGYQAAERLGRLLAGKRIPAREWRTLVPPVGVRTRQSTDTLAITNPVITSALGYIRENAGRPLLVDEVAEHAGVSRRKLERHFLHVMGRTPADQIRHVQVERAKTLLAETNRPIPEVAEAAGFGSPEYMATVFQKKLGLTPLKYRKKRHAVG